MTLVEFLTARLDEREERAECIHDTSCGMLRHDGTCDCGEPERVRAEVEAMRQNIAEHVQLGVDDECSRCVVWDTDSEGELCATPLDHPCRTLRLFARPDAVHPDFKPEWHAT